MRLRDGRSIAASVPDVYKRQIQNAVENAKCQEAYPFEFNARQYQADFANLLVTLEIAKAKAETQEEIASDIEPHYGQVYNKKQSMARKATFADVMRTIFTSKQVRYAGSTAAAIAITVVSGVIAANAVSRGGL